jgi:hypothetical protein
MNARAKSRHDDVRKQEPRITGTGLVSPELLSCLTDVALALARRMADNDHEERVAALESKEGKIPKGTKRPVGSPFHRSRR